MACLPRRVALHLLPVDLDHFIPRPDLRRESARTGHTYALRSCCDSAVLTADLEQTMSKAAE